MTQETLRIELPEKTYHGTDQEFSVIEECDASHIKSLIIQPDNYDRYNPSFSDELLVTIPETISRLVAVETIKINAFITELPVELSKLNNLKLLDLTGCYNLLSIPDEITEMKDLKIKVGDIISRVPEVVFITVPRNRITQEVFSKIRSAKEKKIEQLIIRQMPPSSYEQRQEEFEVPDEIQHLNELKLLSITGNVSSLPSWIHSSLTLSSISITPSDSTTLTQLNESLIVSASGCNINIHGCMFECVELKDGNGSAMNSRVADDCTFVVVNTSLSNCSAMYGGGVYVDISGHPLLVNMSEVIYEGNNASKEGMTLYVVWRSISNMESNEFSSFVGLSEEMDGGEAKVERWNGGIVRLEEFVRGGWMSGYGVNAQIEISEDVGMIVVEVVEDGGGEGGVVGMEGGEVSGEVVMGGSGVGEVNGEGVRVSMGNALTRVLQRCENIEIVMNVTYGGSNG